MPAVLKVIAGAAVILVVAARPEGIPVVTPFAGPYAMIPKSMSNCNDPGTNKLRILSSKLNKINRTAFWYSTQIILPVTIDDDVSMDLVLWVSGNGGWKLLTDHKMPNACRVFQTYVPGFAKLFLKMVGKEECPLPAGNYTFDSGIFQGLNIKAFPVFPYGLHRGDLSFLHKGRKIGCKSATFEVVPRGKK
ncbi:hypothetical protein AAG570_004370 [Ranatra chinensis]|uniref:Uncharacterized protein n=1 Tax=Ranatra chinensis TaxID=642074 RepID=A0ABD0Y1I1_9HEMI